MENDYDDYLDDDCDGLHDMEEGVMARDDGHQYADDVEVSDDFFDDEV